MQAALVAVGIHRERMIRLADGLAAACAISLPWSTSATGILVVCWLVALVATLDVAAVRRELLTPAGGLPALLWLLGVAGTLWADASIGERLGGLDSFHKLLAIPLLLAQFRRSGNASWVIGGYVASCTVLLAASYAHALFFDQVRGLHRLEKLPGVPVKDYILQSGEFQLCAFGLIYVAVDAWRAGRRGLAAALAALASAFLADIAYVVTSRTAIAAMPVLLVLIGLRQLGWKRTIALVAAGAALAGVMWASSPYLRARVGGIIGEIQRYERDDDTVTSAGTRLELWHKSVAFIRDAPIIGHGTGTIRGLFTRAAAPGTETDSSLGHINPHQQIFAVAIQIGLVGVVVLVAMWVAHLMMFSHPGLVAWCGLAVTVQNVVGSQFNSHLFDFGHGWTYVFGVGVLGGTVLHQLALGRPAPAEGVGRGAAEL